MIGYIIFTTSVALAFICTSYDSFARAKGWPIGDTLSKDASIPKIIAFVTILWALGKSFFVLSYWSPIFILVLGFIIAFILIMLLKRNVQIWGVLGIFPAALFNILYVSEKLPFGVLHKFIE